jgi:DNA polymerase-3 subunit alpha/error-prone DNA polymerase
MLTFGIKPDYAERIYKTIEGFGSYGFPESHAASFALITSVSCYLKCHYPDVFTCALLNSQPMGFYSPRSLISDAQRHQVRILPADVNHSRYDYTLTATPSELRVGLRALYGIAKNEIEKIEAAQNFLTDQKSLTSDSSLSFQSLSDFVTRTQVKRTTVLRLAAAGCFGSLGLSPRQALWEVLRLPKGFESHWNDLVWSSSENRSDSSSQDSVFMPTMTPWEKVQNDYRALGFSVELHPMGVLRPTLASQLTTAQSLGAMPSHSKVRVAGMVSVRQRPPTAGGTVFLTLEDEFGFINVVIPRWVYGPYRMVVISEAFLEVEGRVETRDGVVQIQAEKLEPLTLQKSLKSKPEPLTQIKSRDFQ